MQLVARVARLRSIGFGDAASVVTWKMSSTIGESQSFGLRFTACDRSTDFSHDSGRDPAPYPASIFNKEIL